MGGSFRATLRQDGFPDPFQVLEVTLVEASVVGSAHWRDDFHYDPQTQGAISTIEYSWDVNMLDPGHLFFSLLLVQGDTYYRTGVGFQRQDWPQVDGWRKYGRVGLRPNDFLRVQGPGPDKPDFTQPMTIGYVTRLSTPSDPAVPISRNAGIDNFKVTIVKEPVLCVPQPPNLVSWWPGEGSADDVLETNPGTLVGEPTFVDDWVGQAFDFDGIDDHVMIPNSPSINRSGSFTVEAWIRPSSYPLELAPVISKWNDIGTLKRGFVLGVTPDGTVRFDISTNGLGSPLPAQPGTGQAGGSGAQLLSLDIVGRFARNHVAGTFDAETGDVCLYVNGEESAQVTAPFDSVFRSTEPLLIGAGDFGSDMRDFFHGKIDEVKLYRRALSAEEIRAVFEARQAGQAIGDAPCEVEPDVVLSAVVNSATNAFGDVSEQMIVASYGVNLAQETVAADPPPLPIVLGDTMFAVTDSLGVERDMELYVVSNGQVNGVIPAGTALGQGIVTVKNPLTTGIALSAGAKGTETPDPSWTINVAPVAPGIFSADASGQGTAAALVLVVKPDQSRETTPIFDELRAPVPVVVDGPDLAYLLLFGTGIRGFVPQSRSAWEERTSPYWPLWRRDSSRGWIRSTWVRCPLC